MFNYSCKGGRNTSEEFAQGWQFWLSGESRKAQWNAAWLWGTSAARVCAPSAEKSGRFLLI